MLEPSKLFVFYQKYLFRNWSISASFTLGSNQKTPSEKSDVVSM